MTVAWVVRCHCGGELERLGPLGEDQSSARCTDCGLEGTVCEAGTGGSMVFKMDHPTDPRWLLTRLNQFHEPPETIPNQEVFSGAYGRPLAVDPMFRIDAVYEYDLETDAWLRKDGDR